MFGIHFFLFFPRGFFLIHWTRDFFLFTRIVMKDTPFRWKKRLEMANSTTWVKATAVQTRQSCLAYTAPSHGREWHIPVEIESRDREDGKEATVLKNGDMRTSSSHVFLQSNLVTHPSPVTILSIPVDERKTRSGEYPECSRSLSVIILGLIDSISFLISNYPLSNSFIKLFFIKLFFIKLFFIKFLFQTIFFQTIFYQIPFSNYPWSNSFWSQRWFRTLSADCIMKVWWLRITFPSLDCPLCIAYFGSLRLSFVYF